MEKQGESDPELHQAEILIWNLSDPDYPANKKPHVLDRLFYVRWLGDEKLRLAEWVYKLVYCKYPDLDRDEVEDIVANVLLKTWEDIKDYKCKNLLKIHARGYSDDGELTKILVVHLGWKIRAALTSYFRQCKKERSRVRIDETEGREIEFGNYDTLSTEDECAEFIKISRQYGAGEDAIKMLTMYVEGYSIKEIAREIGKTDGAVKTNIYRWRKKVREIRMKEQQPGPTP